MTDAERLAKIKAQTAARTQRTRNRQAKALERLGMGLAELVNAVLNMSDDDVKNLKELLRGE